MQVTNGETKFGWGTLQSQTEATRRIQGGVEVTMTFVTRVQLDDLRAMRTIQERVVTEAAKIADRDGAQAIVNEIGTIINRRPT